MINKKENDLIFEGYSKSVQRRLAIQKKNKKGKDGKDIPVEPKTLKPGAKFCAKHEQWFDELKECSTCAKHKKRRKKIVNEETESNIDETVTLSSEEQRIIRHILAAFITSIHNLETPSSSTREAVKNIINKLYIAKRPESEEPHGMSNIEADADTLASA